MVCQKNNYSANFLIFLFTKDGIHIAQDFCETFYERLQESHGDMKDLLSREGDKPESDIKLSFQSIENFITKLPGFRKRVETKIDKFIVGDKTQEIKKLIAHTLFCYFEVLRHSMNIVFDINRDPSATDKAYLMLYRCFIEIEKAPPLRQNTQ